MYIGVCAGEVVYILAFLGYARSVGGDSTPQLLRANGLYYSRVIFQRINVSKPQSTFTLCQHSIPFQYLLSDGVVCWRAWVLYYDKKVAQGMLILCMIGSFGA